MEEIDINNSLQQEDLFEQFRSQLKKDFEGAGIAAGFTNDLPSDLHLLKERILQALQPLFRGNMALLSSLFYRIDISEQQLKNYEQQHKHLSFEELAAELIIKRVLQKVILRKRFSE